MDNKVIVKVAPFANDLHKRFAILHEYKKSNHMIFCKLFGLIKVGRNFVFLSIQSMILEKIYLGHDYAKKPLMC